MTTTCSTPWRPPSWRGAATRADGSSTGTSRRAEPSGRRVLRLAIGDPAPSAERIEALLDAAEGPRGGVTIELGGGRRASVRERRIRLE